MEDRQEKQVEMSGASTTIAVDPLARQRVVFCTAACILLGLSATLAYFHVPGPPCLVRLMFHIACPGCGLTRSFKELCGGNVIASFRYHPLGLPFFAILTAYASAVIASGPLPYFRIIRDRIEAAVSSPKFLVGVTILMISVWTIRMGLSWAGNNYFWW